MNDPADRWPLAVMSGADRSFRAAAMRGGLSVIEPFYAAAMRLRNRLYDGGIFRAHKLPRPTISVGNLTTGGTGKTPVVQWLAERLIERNKVPAILMRGYRGGDEQRMLAEHLGDRAIVIANPDRLAGAAEAMKHQPPPDVFLLDDGFQHRRAGRDFNLVLINVAEPFGFNHVLPRGLLREPIAGIRRADAVLITRCASDAKNVETTVRRHTTAPIFRADHIHSGLRDPAGGRFGLDELSARRFFVFSGIGDPNSFRRQFEKFGNVLVGSRTFADHYAYRDEDLATLRHEAEKAGADVLITTEKDWVKIAELPSARVGLPILRTELRLNFHHDHERELLGLISRAVQIG